MKRFADLLTFSLIASTSLFQANAKNLKCYLDEDHLYYATDHVSTREAKIKAIRSKQPDNREIDRLELIINSQKNLLKRYEKRVKDAGGIKCSYAFKDFMK